MIAFSFIHILEGAFPENALTGTIFTVNAWRNDPLIVPYEYRCVLYEYTCVFVLMWCRVSDGGVNGSVNEWMGVVMLKTMQTTFTFFSRLRFWRNTSVANLAPGESRVMRKGIGS